MEAHLIRTTHFIGITCTAFQHHKISQELTEPAQEQQLHFRCSTGSHNISLNNFPLKVKLTICTLCHYIGNRLNYNQDIYLQNTIALASVTLPATLFPPDVPNDCKLQVAAFRSGRFFPLSENSSRTRAHSQHLSVNTPVIYVGLGKDEDVFSSFYTNANHCLLSLLFRRL